MPGAHASARGNGRLVVAGVAILALIAGGAYVAVTRGSDGDPAANISPTAAPSPDPANRADVVAEFPDPALGRRVTLNVVLMRDEADCTLHTMDGLRAFWSDCAWLAGATEGANVFYVQIKNETDEPMHLELDAFSLETPRGRILDPLPFGEVLDGWHKDGLTLLPGVSKYGLLAFPGRGIVPGWLTYRDGDQRITIHFPGPHAISTG